MRDCLEHACNVAGSRRPAQPEDAVRQLQCAVEIAVAGHQHDAAVGLDHRPGAALPDAAAETGGGHGPARIDGPEIGIDDDHPATRGLAVALLQRAERDDDAATAADACHGERRTLLAFGGGEQDRRVAVGGSIFRALQAERRLCRSAVGEMQRAGPVGAAAVVAAGADPGDQIDDAAVDHRGGKNAPVVVDRVGVDVAGAADRLAQDTRPDQGAGFVVERQHAVGHGGDDGEAAAAAVLEDHVIGDQHLRLRAARIAGQHQVAKQPHALGPDDRGRDGGFLDVGGGTIIVDAAAQDRDHGLSSLLQ